MLVLQIFLAVLVAVARVFAGVLGAIADVFLPLMVAHLDVRQVMAKGFAPFLARALHPVADVFLPVVEARMGACFRVLLTVADILLAILQPVLRALHFLLRHRGMIVGVRGAGRGQQHQRACKGSRQQRWNVSCSHVSSPSVCSPLFGTSRALREFPRGIQSNLKYWKCS